MKSEKEIGEIVRSLRGNLSLREFGEKCGISHTTIDNIEKGVDFRTGKPTQVKMVTLEKIASACGKKTSIFLDETPKLQRGSNQTIASRLATMRNIKGRSQQDVAEAIGVPIQTYSEWESGKSRIDDSNLLKLADYYGERIDYIAGRSYELRCPVDTWIQDLRDDYYKSSEYTKEYMKLRFGDLVFFDDDNNTEQNNIDDDLKVALFGGDQEVTDEMWEEVKRYAEYVKSRHKN